MQLPLIGKVGWQLAAGLVVFAALMWGLLAYLVQAEMAQTLIWCASKGERCAIAREVDEKQVNELRSEAGL